MDGNARRLRHQRIISLKMKILVIESKQVHPVVFRRGVQYTVGHRHVGDVSLERITGHGHQARDRLPQGNQAALRLVDH